MSRQENDEDGSVGGGSFDGFTQCEALVNQPAWTRLRNSPNAAGLVLRAETSQARSSAGSMSEWWRAEVNSL